MKKITHSFYVLIFFFIGIFSYAQSVSGKISDKEGNAIPYAEILLTKGKIRKSALSDEKGNFIVKLPENGDYSFEVFQDGSRVYIRTVTVNTDNKTELIISNKPNEKSIQEVVITKKVIQHVGDKTYFNVENSVLSKGNNVLELIQKSPKLSTNPQGEILLKNKSAIVLIDGRKTNLSGSDLVSYLETLNSENIKRIEIQDVASASEDASTSNGLINIILKKKPKGFRAITKMYYLFRKENYNAYNSSLNLNYGSENWNIYSNISYNENTDYGESTGIFNYTDGQKNINLGNFKQDNNNLGVRLGSMFYPNENNSIGVEGYYSKSNMNFDSTGSLDIIKNNVQTIHSENYSLSKTLSDLWYVTLNYTLKLDELGSNIKFIGDLGKNNSTPSNDVSSIYPNDSSLNNHYLYDTDSKSKYYTAQLDWIQKFKNDWELGSGVKFGSVKRSNLLNVNYYEGSQWYEDFDQKQNFDNRENISAGYVSLSKTFNKHFFKAGFRIENTNVKGVNNLNSEKVNQNYTKLFPNIYYKYSFSNDKSIYASYKKSISRPSFRDLNPFVIKQNDYLYQIGNPNLKPEFKDSFELGTNINKHSLSLTLSKTKNTIQGNYYTTQDINYFQTLNLGDDFQASLDYSFNGDLNKWLFINISTGVYRNYFKYDNVRIKGNSFYNNIYGRGKISKSLMFELFNNFSTPYNYRNTKNALWYRMDLAIQKTFSGSAVLKLKVNDIFNTQRDKNTTIQKNFDFDFYQKRITRQIVLSFQYTLDNKQKTKATTVNSDNESRNRL